MATIREISKIANVSIATVSKVINGKSGVSKETVKKVNAVAKSLNYLPHLYARQLRSGRSHTLGIITEDLTVFNAPEIVDGIAETCDSRSYHYILGNLRFNKRYGYGSSNLKESNTRVRELVDNMLTKQVDGIIYIGCHSHVVVSLSDHADTNFVCAYCQGSGSAIPSIVYNDHLAAFEVTELLIHKGHSNIGVITGPVSSMHTANRVLGYQDALYQHRLPYNPRLTMNGDWGRNSGFALAGPLISAGVTAIFAQNDLMAIGVIDYCNQNRIEVGRDLALIGFDNSEIGKVTKPTLSTVSLPLFEIGQTSANIMIDILEGGKSPAQNLMQLKCTIIERESTGESYASTDSDNPA